MSEVTCDDCEYCGVIVDDFPPEGRLQKHCPEEYFFNHPNVKDCPNMNTKNSDKRDE